MSNLYKSMFCGPQTKDIDVASDDAARKADAEIAKLKASMTAEQWVAYQAEWYAKHVAKK